MNQDLASIFRQLTDELINTQALWRPDPFLMTLFGCPWKPQFPALYEAIEQMLEEGASPLHLPIQDHLNLGHLFDAMAKFNLSICSVNGWQSISKEETGSEITKLMQGVPGRKLAQIHSFSQYTYAKNNASKWLEWCSGKGYLGRFLTHTSQRPVESFEWQESLCQAGQSYADKHGLAMRFIQGDAFADESQHIFCEDQHVVALHACGDLHIYALKHAISAGSKQISFSPCCYHLIQGDVYHALSRAGQSARLSLSKQDLRIPLQQTVTGGARVQRHRQTEMSYRLGFAAMLKQEFAFKDYEPIPSIKKSQLSEGFASFCQWAIKAKQLSIRLPQDLEYWEQVGQALFYKMEALGAVQEIFKRPLEVWLALDKMLYLEENGYRAEIIEFCKREQSPRNFLIHGTRL